MARARDSQRQKVYNAEHLGFRPNDPEAQRQVNLDEAQQIVDILSVEFEVRQVNVQVNRRMKQYGAWYRTWEQVIELPRNFATVGTILHEFSHHLAHERKVGEPGHGPGYTECMLDVLQAWIGKQAREAMAAAYAARGVKVGSNLVLARKAEEQARRARDGEEDTVYVIGYAGYRGTTFLKSLDYWDMGTTDIQSARVYKTMKGAINAAKKIGEAQVYSARASYSSFYNRYIPNYSRNELTMMWESV